MNKLSSSFRDPSGFMFRHEGRLYRQINQSASEDYQRLMDSGLYELLTSKHALTPHAEVDNINPDAWKTIEPEHIPLISYPYEWSFEQLRDAAILTLKIQKAALNRDLSLKDASAYNIQFRGFRPVFIDTLSFEPYVEGHPWVAYKQFCQHFYAPLVLASLCDFRLTGLLRTHIDGIPLDLASGLLPFKTRLNVSIASHIHFHAKSQAEHANDQKDAKGKVKLSKKGMLNIINDLESSIKKLKWNAGDTEWGDYYNNTNYSESSFDAKKNLVSRFIKDSGAKTLWDLGANDGTFSSLAAKQGIYTVAFDIDPIAVNKNHIQLRKDKNEGMLALLTDLTNPSPSLGWAHEERDSLRDRGNADCVMALALIHHLAISNNLPFHHISKYFAELSAQLIIEFVPKSDSKVQILLASREDIFPDYNLEGFEQAFGQHWDIRSKEPVEGSERTLYHLIRKA